MKSLLYWSVALPALLAGAPALAGNDSPNYEPYGPEYAPTAPYDDGAYDWDDRVYSQEDAQSGIYDGTWTGNYVDDEGQIYQGEWQGTYVDEHGQAYEGTYRGTSVGEPRYGYDTSGVATAPYDGPAGPGYDPGPGYDHNYAGPAPEPAYDYERHDDGIGGAIIGGVAGGVAGNVIAGRGNRLAGTLIGGGIGAVAGAAIDQAEDRGPPPQRYYREDRRAYSRQAPAYGDNGYYRGGASNGYGAPTSYGWQGRRTSYRGSPGYYYQPQGYTGATTTVVVVPGQTTSTTTTTVTEEEYVVSNRGRHDKRIIRKGR